MTITSSNELNVLNLKCILRLSYGSVIFVQLNTHPISLTGYVGLIQRSTAVVIMQIRVRVRVRCSHCYRSYRANEAVAKGYPRYTLTATPTYSNHSGIASYET